MTSKALSLVYKDITLYLVQAGKKRYQCVLESPKPKKINI